ncbi:MAG: PEP-CTERM sorting domain-containing protein [Pirellulales bacterium]|nr:PEP-CTERM sorting domain-containing protein [Pirellulales bacterium]
MRMTILGFSAALAVATSAMLGFCPRAANAAFITTGTYDETTNQGNNVDTEADDNNISLADFKTLIADAFVNDLGGVVDFDTTESGTTGLGGADTGSGSSSGGSNVMNAVYGTSQSNDMVITRLHREGGSTTNNFKVAASASGFESISGASAADADQKYLYSTGSGSYGFRLTFSQPIWAFGITFLSRVSDSVDMQVGLSDGSVIDFTDETIDASVGTDDTFFGYRETAGRTISYIRLASNNDGTYGRYDDLAFIVVPEPASVGSFLLMGLGGCLAVRRRLAIGT